MSETVLDSSVLIAIANNEPYDDEIVSVIEGAVMSTVNFCEVLAKLRELGISLSAPL